MSAPGILIQQEHALSACGVRLRILLQAKVAAVAGLVAPESVLCLQCYVHRLVWKTEGKARQARTKHVPAASYRRSQCSGGELCQAAAALLLQSVRCKSKSKRCFLRTAPKLCTQASRCATRKALLAAERASTTTEPASSARFAARWWRLAGEQRSSRPSRSRVPFTRTTGAASGPLLPPMPAIAVIQQRHGDIAAQSMNVWMLK